MHLGPLCLVMHLGPNTKQLYSVGSSEHLSSVNETRDLGIWMDSALKFLMLCSKATNMAMQALGWIKRTFKYITPQSFLILYKTYIRPHLGTSGLCQHNFEHNRSMKALSIMPA